MGYHCSYVCFKDGEKNRLRVHEFLLGDKTRAENEREKERKSKKLAEYGNTLETAAGLVRVMRKRKGPTRALSF